MNEVFIYILKQVHLTKSHCKTYCVSIVQKYLILTDIERNILPSHLVDNIHIHFRELDLH